MSQANPVKRFFERGKPRGKATINAMCAFCVGCTAEIQGKGFVDHVEAGFRETISQCEVYACPIHHLRPYQKKAETTNQGEVK